MIDLSEKAIEDWFAPVGAPDKKNVWPPWRRKVEQSPIVEPMLEAVGLALGDLENEPRPRLAQMLESNAVRDDLRTLLSQLGSARLLRLIEWLATVAPDGTGLILDLTHGESLEAQAISSSLRALTGRSTISRIFSPARAAELQSCTVAAKDPLEMP